MMTTRKSAIPDAGLSQLPETAKRTFAEIDEMYESGIPMRKWRSYQTSPETKLAKVVNIPTVHL